MELRIATWQALDEWNKDVPANSGLSFSWRLLSSATEIGKTTRAKI